MVYQLMKEENYLFLLGGAGTCEMLITKGETLTLVGEDPGDGWALVMNDRGDNGYVPSSYIKPSLPPKPKIRKSP